MKGPFTSVLHERALIMKGLSNYFLHERTLYHGLCCNVHLLQLHLPNEAGGGGGVERVAMVGTRS